MTGRISPEDPDRIIGFSGSQSRRPCETSAWTPPAFRRHAGTISIVFIELHIEQGPILEQAGLPVAIVTGITGVRHYLVTLTGTQNHAGAFPMDMRRDPMAGFAEIARD